MRFPASLGAGSVLPSPGAKGPRIRVVLAGACDGTRTRVERVAAAHGWLLRDYPGLSEAAAALSGLRASLLLLAGSQVRPTRGGLGEVKLAAPEIPVIILGESRIPAEIARFIMAGADGYIVETAPWRHFERTVVSAANGKGFLCKLAQEALVRHVQSQTGRLLSFDLSPLECAIAPYLLQSLKEKEIAERIGLRDPTLHTHLKRLYHKLSVHNRQGAVRRLYYGRLNSALG